MSKYTDSMYVIQLILAQIGRTGGVFPGGKGGGRGHGISNLCSLGRRYSRHGCIFSGCKNGSRNTSAK